MRLFPTASALLLVLSLAPLAASGLNVTSLRLFHSGRGEADFLDSSEDGAPSPQVLQVSFRLEDGEEVEAVTFWHGNDLVAFMDTDYASEVFPPLDPSSALVTIASSAASLSLSAPVDLDLRGEWTAEVASSGGDAANATADLLGFKSCGEGYAVTELEVDADSCLVTYAAACQDGGRIFPDPTLAVVGLASDLYESDYNGGYVASGLLQEEDGSAKEDGSFRYSVENVTYRVNDSTPKLLVALLEVDHGPDPLDKDYVVDKTRVVLEDTGLEIFDSYGCADLPSYCSAADRGDLARPFLPGLSADEELDGELGCRFDEEEGGAPEAVPEYDAAPCRDEVRPEDLDGVLVLTFECAEGCVMDWSNSTAPDLTQQSKVLRCGRDSLHWEDDRDEDQDEAAGAWPSCDCSIDDGSTSSSYLHRPRSLWLLLGIATLLFPKCT